MFILYTFVHQYWFLVSKTLEVTYALMRDTLVELLVTELKRVHEDHFRILSS